MKKVLFITTSDLMGSSGNNVASKEIVDAFARNESLSVSVVCPAPLDGRSQSLSEEVSEFHFVIPRIDMSISNHFKTQLSMFSKIGSVLTKKEFDLLVIRHAPVMIAPTMLSKLFRVPYVLLARGLPHERLRFSSLLKKIFQFNARLAEDVYCAHSEIVDQAEEIRPSSKSRPVLFTNAVDPNKFTQYSQKEARERINQPYEESDFVIGFVGSLKSYHMVEELIRATERIESDIYLLILGDGPERESLERLVEDQNLGNQVTFTGFVEHDRVNEYIAACDIMYGAIDPDHFGNAIKCYEYLASGRSIITDNRPEFEFVEAIDAGITIDNVTIVEIAAAIRRLRSMSRQERLEMGARGREYVLKNHTWDSLVELVIERNL
jgi:glycosyltransferase involved in cell wall biosynthesis